jgi:hypothetical protein
VASLKKEMEWNVQGKGIFVGHFNFTGRRLSKDVLDKFRIDNRTIRRGILVS